MADRVRNFLRRRRGRKPWVYEGGHRGDSARAVRGVSHLADRPVEGGRCACLAVKGVGQLDAGKLHVQFDEGVLETPARCGP